MRETRPYGSVRGAASDGRPYRDSSCEVVEANRTYKSPVRTETRRLSSSSVHSRVQASLNPSRGLRGRSFERSP